ncbi:hypothetical protein E4K10_30705 [Streptomyces sp. T1317-0309]|nr:hypothetical protein E4K10_30705 [Streptomyces sp. T1317-0309]
MTGPSAFPPTQQSDGAAWWGSGLFPNPTIPVTTFTFDQVVTAEFSIGMSFLTAAAPGQNQVQLPAGAQPLSLPPGYSYDRATSILSIDATVTGCPQIQTPTREITARFRVTGVTTFALQYLGTRAIVTECKKFGNWAFGAVDVSLGGQFLRTVCWDCDGTVSTVTDTALDGVTPYTPVGEVGVCEPPTPAVPEVPCPSTVQVLRLCDLNPDVDPDADGNRCATPFLRHLVYDCTGTVTSTLDTAMDGVTAYTPVQAVDCGTGGVPALTEVVWPQTGIVEDPALPGGQDFIYTVTNPDTGDAATVHLHASSAAGGACGAYDPTHPVFNNPTSYTLALSPEAQAMTRFRLDFLDLDNFEGVNALTPRPDNVASRTAPAPTTRPPGTSAPMSPPTPDLRCTPTGTRLRPPSRGGTRTTAAVTACAFVAFLGTTLKAGGCCSGCGSTSDEDSPGEPGQACGPVQTFALCDTAPDGTVVTFLRHLAYDCDGLVSTVTDTAVDGTTPYTPTGTVGLCSGTGSSPGTPETCTYTVPDTVSGFNTANAAFPGCWSAPAAGPSPTNTGTASPRGRRRTSRTRAPAPTCSSTPPLGGLIDFTTFTRPSRRPRRSRLPAT